jgi:CBS domain-containing protein
MKARDLMTPEPYVVLPGDPVARAAEIMRDHDIGAVPVVDDREGMILVGVITDRDLAIRHVAAGHDPGCPVRKHMTAHNLVTVRPDTEVNGLMKRMRRSKVRRVMVTDVDGVLKGVVAQADLLRVEGEEHPKRVERVLAVISEPAELPR